MAFRLFTNVENVRKTGELSISTTPLPATQVVATAGGDSPTYTTTTAVNDNVIDLSDVEAGNLIVSDDGYQAIISAINDGANTLTIKDGEWYSPAGERGAPNGNIKPTDGQGFSVQRVSVVRSIAITADESNTALVYVGRDGTARITDYPLNPGESVGLGDDDFVHVPKVFVRAASGTQKIHWILGAPSGAGNFAAVVPGGVAGGITWITFADGDTTPDVSAGNGGITANTAPTTITDLDGATNTEFIINFNDNDTTIANSGSIKLEGGIPYTGLVRDTMTFVHNGTLWLEKARSGNG